MRKLFTAAITNPDIGALVGGILVLALIFIAAAEPTFVLQ